MATIGYVTIGSNRLDEALAFYDPLLASAGIDGLRDHRRGGRIYGKGDTILLVILRPYDGEPATVGNGSMLALRFDSRAQVDAFHARALALGASDEGPPGERGNGWHFAYFRDLDGNKICGFCSNEPPLP